MTTKPHVAQNSGNNEWYTPPHFIEAARKVMGSIDVDPASNDIAQQVVKAGVYFTQETNGLDKSWVGNVWMNPPYSASLIKQFASKLKQETTNGNTDRFCVLVNNATETKWFKDICSVTDAVCFLTKRVSFLNSQGEPTRQPLQGQVILYSGDNFKEFGQEFAKYGIIMKVVY